MMPWSFANSRRHMVFDTNATHREVGLQGGIAGIGDVEGQIGHRGACQGQWWQLLWGDLEDWWLQALHLQTVFCSVAKWVSSGIYLLAEMGRYVAEPMCSTGVLTANHRHSIMFQRGPMFALRNGDVKDCQSAGTQQRLFLALPEVIFSTNRQQSRSQRHALEIDTAFEEFGGMEHPQQCPNQMAATLYQSHVSHHNTLNSFLVAHQ